MFTMILVDDEEYVIEGLKEHIDWESLNIKIIGQALNGEDGLKAIRKHTPDIVLADVKMPFMNGLEMIRQLCQEGIRSKIIIQSAYDEYQLLREAMNYGVIDYILKPFLPSEIEKTMQKVVRLITHEKSMEMNDQLTRSKLDQAALKRNLLERIFDNSCGAGQALIQQAENMGIDLSGAYYLVIAFGMNSYDSRYRTAADVIRFPLLESCSEYFDINQANLYFDDNRIYLLLGYNQAAGAAERMIVNKVRGFVNRCLAKENIALTAGVGRIVDNPSAIYQSFNEARESLAHKIYKGKAGIVTYAEVEYAKTYRNNLQLYNHKLLIDGLKQRKKAMVDECVADMFERVRKFQMVYNKCLELNLIEMIGATFLTLNDLGENVEETIVFNESPNEVILNSSELTEVRDWLQKFFHQIDRILSNGGKHKKTRIINEVVDYVKDNYDKEPSLQKIAKQLGLSPNYLSNLFTRHFGENFTDYLNRYRIEKAKELLTKGRYKVGCIAAMVGFSDDDYFRKIFKRFTGMNPSEYIQ